MAHFIQKLFHMMMKKNDKCGAAAENRFSANIIPNAYKRNGYISLSSRKT